MKWTSTRQKFLEQKASGSRGNQTRGVVPVQKKDETASSIARRQDIRNGGGT